MTVVFLAVQVNAATYTVLNTGDAGADTLRAAIQSANAHGGADTIAISATGTLTLQSDLPAITESVTIDGPGVASFTISGDDQYRIFFIDSGTVTIQDVTLADGLAQGGSGGASRYAGAGGGAAGMGGAIFINTGTVTITNVAFEGNAAIGGNGGASHAPDPSDGGGGGGGIGGNGQDGGIFDFNGGDGGDGGALGGTGGAGGDGFSSPGGAGGEGDGGGGGGIGESGGAGGFAGGGGGAGSSDSGADGGEGGYGGGGGGNGDGNGERGAGGAFAGDGGFSPGGYGGGGGGGAGLGGAIFVRAGTTTITDCTFTSNTATGGTGGTSVAGQEGEDGQGKGGAVFAHADATVTAEGVTFTSNTASDDVGSDSDNDDVYDVTVIANTAPDAPTGLGPAAYVDGSEGTEKSPALEFTTADDDGDDLTCRIQIDDSSDFASPVVDYTSVAAAPGAATFTVGQAAGGGTYTEGAEDQELDVGAYYWRVRCNDGTDDGEWAVANGGAVAFEVTQPTVDFWASSYGGQEDDGAITVTVTLSSASDEQITVEYGRTGGTAVNGVDYAAFGGTLTFSPGDTSKTFTITPVSDSSFESNETISIGLSNAVNATLGSTHNPCTVTIMNDDGAPGGAAGDNVATGTTDEEGAVNLDNATSSAEVAGFDPELPATLETDQDGTTTLTIGEDDAPSLVVEADQLGTDLRIELDQQDVGNDRVTLHTGNGETITIELRNAPASPHVIVHRNSDGTIMAEVSGQNSGGQPPRVIVTRMGDNARMHLRVSFDGAMLFPTALVAGFPGLENGESYGGAVEIENLEPDDDGTFTVQVAYEEADVTTADELRLRLHRRDEATGTYVPAGDADVGVGQPTGVLGEYGVDPEEDLVWAEVSALGTFAVGVTEQAAPPDDGSGSADDGSATDDGDLTAEEPENPHPTCGAGAPGGLFISLLGLTMIRHRSRRAWLHT